MENIELFDYYKFNSNKKTIVAFSLEHIIDKKKYNVTTRYFYNTLNILKKDFNILLITRNTGNSAWTEIARNDDYTKDFMYISFDCKNKNYYNANAKIMSSKQSYDYIISTIHELENEYPELCKSFIATINTNNTIPGLNLNTEIISNGDPVLLKKQITASERYKKSLSNHKIFSYTSFLYKPYAFGYTFISYLMEYYDIQHYCFTHATSSLWVIYTKQYNPFTKNLKCFYHIDQNIENREFVEFPIVQLNDCYNNKHNINSINDYKEILRNKKIDFLFGGLFPTNIESRKIDWYKYFNDLTLDNSKIRTQIGNSWKINEKKFSKQINENDEQFIIDIKNHKLTSPTLDYDEYNNELKQSMFTILLQCYPGKYDHFTLRLVSSLFFGCIPLIAEEYDSNMLQIPKQFRDKLLVKSNKDIEDKILYYKNNIDEYEQLFYDMWNYYINEKHFDICYYESEFKNNLFKEIY